MSELTAALVAAVARQRHVADGPHAQAQALGVEQGHMGADQPGGLQPLDAAAHLRGRQVDGLAQCLVGGVRIGLQCSQ